MFRWLRQILRPPLLPVSAPFRTEIRPNVTVTPPTDEEGAILHAFWAKPDQKKRREAIVEMLRQRLDEMLGSMGFVRESGTWGRDLPTGRATVRIRGFRSGDSATLEVGFVPTPGRKPIEVYEPLLNQQLANFVNQGEGAYYNNGTFYYAVIDHEPSALEFTLAVLRERALPWALDHGTGAYPKVDSYCDRPLRL